jgi:hypothetical protein
MDLKALRKPTREEFTAEAFAGVDKSFQEYAKPAAEWVFDHIGADRRNLSYVSSLAAWMSEHEGQSPLPLMASDFVLSDLICERAKPVAEDIRQAVFGKSKPPFKDMATAIEWLEKEAQSRDAVRTKKGTSFSERGLQLHQEARAAGVTLNVTIEKHLLYHPSAVAGWAKTVDGSFNRKLRRLSVRVDDLAEKTGWHPGNALMFVLTGAKPLTPRFRLHSRSSEIRQWWVLEIGTNTVSREDVTRILASMRPKQGRKRPLTDKGIGVFLFVRKHRPAKTWLRILAEWNAQHPEQVYKSVRGMRMAYNKVKKEGKQ